jgi:outer membrane protein insertion porin family
MIHGVTFIDFGTVEEKVELHSSSFRVAPGFGLRVQLPYAGLGAPLAFDFAFPVATADGDQEQTFSFLIGVVR